MATILLAGATGALGGHIAEALVLRGHAVRALGRSQGRLAALASRGAQVHVGDALVPASLAGACDGVDAVVSCLGASVMPGLAGWRGYMAVDTLANVALIDAARGAGVGRFVYVSTHHTPAMRRLHYVRAHEAVVDRLRTSGLSYSVVRPTGFFSALALYLKMAERGAVPLLGDGSARSNPIDDAELADICAEAVDGGPAERSVGGPEVLTRRQMAELAFEAWGRPVRLARAPVGLAKAVSLVLRPIHPRMAQLTAFIAAISEEHAVAEQVGRRTLGTFFRDEVARRAPLLQSPTP